MTQMTAQFPELTMMVVAFVQLIASPAFGGLAGSWIFDRLRGWFPADRASDETPAWQRPIYIALWRKTLTPFTSKMFTFVGGLMSAFAVAFLAYIAGGDALIALDEAIASLISGVIAIGWGETRHQAKKKAQEESPW